MPSPRLDSWKSIAEYLHRDVRTAIRWEKDRGLPVHRIPGGKRGGVFAYQSELDEWLARQDGPAPEPVKPSPPRKVIWGAAGLAAAALIAVVLTQLGTFSNPFIAQVTVRGKFVTALDARGGQLWQYTLPAPMPELTEQDQKWRIRIADLDGNGRQEVLVTARFPQGETPYDQHTLYCLSQRGKLLWTYSADKVQLEFAARSFDANWRFADMLVIPRGKGMEIWLAVDHNVWWPSFIARIDARGQAAVQYVSSGLINSLYYDAAKKRILAGGVNNEYSAASLAVLDLNAPPSASPQSPESRFHCRECPTGLPEAYVLFPRSEANHDRELLYNAVVSVYPSGAGIGIQTEENARLFLYYELTGDLAPKAVSFNRRYHVFHDLLQSQSKLDHSFADCPEQHAPVLVREWQPSTGWREIPVAHSADAP